MNPETSKKETFTLDQIRHMQIDEVKTGLKLLIEKHPEEYQKGRLFSHMLLECHDDAVYDGIVGKIIPSGEDCLRVDYACILKELGYIKL